MGRTNAAKRKAATASEKQKARKPKLKKANPRDEASAREKFCSLFGPASEASSAVLPSAPSVAASVPAAPGLTVPVSARPSSTLPTHDKPDMREEKSGSVDEPASPTSDKGKWKRKGKNVRLARRLEILENDLASMKTVVDLSPEVQQDIVEETDDGAEPHEAESEMEAEGAGAGAGAGAAADAQRGHNQVTTADRRDTHTDVSMGVDNARARPNDDAQAISELDEEQAGEVLRNLQLVVSDDEDVEDEEDATGPPTKMPGWCRLVVGWLSGTWLPE